MNNSLLQACLLMQPFTTELYLVGGCVRDTLLGKEPNDYDIVVNGDLETISTSLIDNGWSVSIVGTEHLVYVVSKGSVLFEVSQFRKARVNHGLTHPRVYASDLVEDAMCRDFTINALYMNPFTGEILDPSGRGLQDLQDKLIRFNGSPMERLKEDKLRGIRMYRFASKLGFDIEPIALRTVRRHFDFIIKETHPERIRLELEKLL